MKKVILIQLWIGKIPDYFWYHYETTKNLNIDFLFVTDQDFLIKCENYKIVNINESDLVDLFKSKTGREIIIEKKRNIVNLKPSLGDLFYEYIKDYEYFGYYDIDTLFGDIEGQIKPFLGEYDFISFGNEKFYNYVSGPLTLIKNTDVNINLYKKEIDKLVHKLKDYFVESFDEHEFNNLIDDNFKTKILYNLENTSIINGSISYNSNWSGGKLKVDNKEKTLFHFYDKKNTNITMIGNTIITSYKKFLNNDFYWVTYLTKNYESLLKGLISSLEKYSNRKCIIYTVNYDSELRFKLNEQFIFRRIDIQSGDMNKNGRDDTIISLKPKILYDSIEFINDGKFVFLDTDIYLTNVCDNINNYFEDLDNYPLINKHIHDGLYVWKENQWINSLNILSETMGIDINIFPKRKTNVILYDKNSQWFFKEQIEIYEKYKNTKPNIFAFHDEDSANILLNKYNFKKSLPLIDIEESDSIDMEKFYNYSYHMTQISQNLILPKTINEIYVFHGFKDVEFYKEIENNYGKTVLTIQDFIINYENKTITFTKNNFLNDKIIENDVCFNLYDTKKNLIFSLKNQKIYNYWVFFISEIDLNGKIIIEIKETSNKRIIYKNLLKL